MKKQIEFDTGYTLYDPDKRGDNSVFPMYFGERTPRAMIHLPKDLDGLLLFNAPRPLYGHFTFQWNFKRGIFYAVVDPNGERAAMFIQRNKELDACMVRFITEAEMRDRVYQWYVDNRPEYLPQIVEMFGEKDEWPWEHVWSSFRGQVEKETETVDIDGEVGGLL